MIIKGNVYLKKLIESKENDLVKVITGIRRCGKSYLPSTLYRNYLISEGVKSEQILTFELGSEKLRSIMLSDFERRS